jgi:hypothetical protein
VRIERKCTEVSQSSSDGRAMPKSVELMESEQQRMAPLVTRRRRRVASRRQLPMSPTALDVSNDVPKLFDISLSRPGSASFRCLDGDNLDAHVGILL